MSLLINVFVVSVFAEGFYGKTLSELNSTAQHFYDDHFDGHAPFPIFPIDHPADAGQTENDVDIFEASALKLEKQNF